MFHQLIWMFKGKKRGLVAYLNLPWVIKNSDQFTPSNFDPETIYNPNSIELNSNMIRFIVMSNN